MKRLVQWLAIVAFVVSAGFGFIHALAPFLHGEHCPFMPGAESVCMMKPVDHFTAWQQSVLASLPQALFAAWVLVVAGVWVVVSAHRKQQPLRVRMQSGAPPPLFVSLFAQGILHAKAP